MMPPLFKEHSIKIIMAKSSICGADDICELSVLEINGISGNADDFVDQYDHDTNGAIEGGCGDMCCDIRRPSQDVLEKYGITKREYYQIAKEISQELSYGYCETCS